jgi:hypothetical protein
MNDIGASLPMGDEHRNQLWRVLEIGIDRDNNVASGIIKSRGKSRLMSEAPTE